MRVVCKLLVLTVLIFANQAFASENTSLQSSGYHQTIELLTSAGLHAQKAQKTSEKVGAVSHSLKIIDHTDNLIRAYHGLAMKRLNTIQNNQSDQVDVEIAQESLDRTLRKIIDLRNKRTHLVERLNSLLHVGEKHNLLGSSSLSFFEIPESVKLNPSLEKMISLQ